LNNFTKWSRNV